MYCAVCVPRPEGRAVVRNRFNASFNQPLIANSFVNECDLVITLRGGRPVRESARRSGDVGCPGRDGGGSGVGRADGLLCAPPVSARIFLPRRNLAQAAHIPLHALRACPPPQRPPEASLPDLGRSRARRAQSRTSRASRRSCAPRATPRSRSPTRPRRCSGGTRRATTPSCPTLSTGRRSRRRRRTCAAGGARTEPPAAPPLRPLPLATIARLPCARPSVRRALDHVCQTVWRP